MVDHDILLQCLETSFTAYGIRGPPLIWLRSYPILFALSGDTRTPCVLGQIWCPCGLVLGFNSRLLHQSSGRVYRSSS